MNNKFVFDVDGTLTPSRKKIDEEFAKFFLAFCGKNDVYFVTGSDKPKTVEQVGEEIFNSCRLSFNCAGNEVWEKNVLIYEGSWKPKEDLIIFLEDLLKNSDFSQKTGKHIEHRKGMVNFSIVGRNCSNEQRELYKDWDKNTNERVFLSEKIRREFPDIDVYIGGETGLDIFEKGKGKSSAIDRIRTSDKDILYYFGDQIFPGGNDYDAAIKCDHYFNIKDWKDTYNFLMKV